MNINKHLITEVSDDENPEYMFQTLHINLIKKLATGQLDGKKYAQKELAQRGLDKNGKWIGFDAAKKYWKL